MRSVNLTTVKGGITRLRTKGAALQDSLYDLLNGYVTSARTVKQRPGTLRLHDLPAGTKGLATFKGRLQVFASSTVEGIPADVDLVVLRSPDGPDIELEEIHFAEPFLGFLYVVAEFADGNVYHFWLQSAPAWEANKGYRDGRLVSPTAGSEGLVFKATRNSSKYPAWAADVGRQIGDKIEPTTYNGFYYEVVAVSGDNPRSGPAEPTWPASEGAQVVEGPSVEQVSDPTTPPADPAPPKPTTTDTRYTYRDVNENDLNTTLDEL